MGTRGAQAEGEAQLDQEVSQCTGSQDPTQEGLLTQEGVLTQVASAAQLRAASRPPTAPGRKSNRQDSRDDERRLRTEQERILDRLRAVEATQKRLMKVIRKDDREAQWAKDCELFGTATKHPREGEASDAPRAPSRSGAGANPKVTRRARVRARSRSSAESTEPEDDSSSWSKDGEPKRKRRKKAVSRPGSTLCEAVDSPGQLDDLRIREMQEMIPVVHRVIAESAEMAKSLERAPVWQPLFTGRVAARCFAIPNLHLSDASRGLRAFLDTDMGKMLRRLEGDWICLREALYGGFVPAVLERAAEAGVQDELAPIVVSWLTAWAVYLPRLVSGAVVLAPTSACRQDIAVGAMFNLEAVLAPSTTVAGLRVAPPSLLPPAPAVTPGRAPPLAVPERRVCVKTSWEPAFIAEILRNFGGAFSPDVLGVFEVDPLAEEQLDCEAPCADPDAIPASDDDDDADGGTGGTGRTGSAPGGDLGHGGPSASLAAAGTGGIHRTVSSASSIRVGSYPGSALSAEDELSSSCAGRWMFAAGFARLCTLTRLVMKHGTDFWLDFQFSSVFMLFAPALMDPGAQGALVELQEVLSAILDRLPAGTDSELQSALDGMAVQLCERFPSARLRLGVVSRLPVSARGVLFKKTVAREAVRVCLLERDREGKGAPWAAGHHGKLACELVAASLEAWTPKGRGEPLEEIEAVALLGDAALGSLEDIAREGPQPFTHCVAVLDRMIATVTSLKTGKSTGADIYMTYLSATLKTLALKYGWLQQRLIVKIY